MKLEHVYKRHYAHYRFHISMLNEPFNLCQTHDYKSNMGWTYRQYHIP